MVSGGDLYLCGIDYGAGLATDGKDIASYVPDLWDGGIVGSDRKGN